MPKVSINILTKDRNQFLKKALDSVASQTLTDYEVIVIDDGSSLPVLKDKLDVKILRHDSSLGISKSRQEALLESQGEYIAVLDDDDEWIDPDKLKKQVEFLDNHRDYVLVGGGIQISNSKSQISKFRPNDDQQIRKTMLLRNNFFTSSVMFRKSSAIQAGGFVADGDDFAEDYDLWLRLGNVGKMRNFPLPFARYRVPNYNKQRYKAFLAKQLRLIYREKFNYPLFWLANLLLKSRLLL